MIPRDCYKEIQLVRKVMFIVFIVITTKWLYLHPTRLRIKVGRFLENSDMQCVLEEISEKTEGQGGRERFIDLPRLLRRTKGKCRSSNFKSTMSLLIWNGIHPKYVISTQWEKVCDLALLTCLHRWSLKNKAFFEKTALYYIEIWTGVLYHMNETYNWVDFSSLTKTTNPNFNWK